MERDESDAVLAQIKEPSLQLKSLLQEHKNLAAETYNYLLKWTFVCQSNFLLHFMRLGLVVVYCAKVLNGDANEQWVGVMIAAHYAVIGLCNLQMCLSLDRYSLDSVVSLHFPVLALFATLEAAANSFSLFAAAYVCAGFGIIWTELPFSASIRMVSVNSATKLTVITVIGTQFCIMLGMAAGGLIASFASFRSVFILSAVWAYISCVFIFCNLRGEGDRLKKEQRRIAEQLYTAFPHAVADENMFRLTAIADDNGAEDQSGLLWAFLSSAESVPFWILAVYSGFRRARVFEFAVWWPLYCDYKWQTTVGQSNLQFIAAVAASIVVTVSAETCIPMAALSEAQQLRRTLVFCGVSAAVGVLLFAVVFPQLRAFAIGWLSFVVFGAIEGVTIQTTAARCVVETPPEVAGSIAAIRTLLQTLIPAMQHVVIGALWNLRADHRYYFYWIALLYALSFALIGWYVAARYALNRQHAFAEYSVID